VIRAFNWRIRPEDEDPANAPNGLVGGDTVLGLVGSV